MIIFWRRFCSPRPALFIWMSCFRSSFIRNDNKMYMHVSPFCIGNGLLTKLKKVHLRVPLQKQHTFFCGSRAIDHTSCVPPVSVQIHSFVFVAKLSVFRSPIVHDGDTHCRIFRPPDDVRPIPKTHGLCHTKLPYCVAHLDRLVVRTSDGHIRAQRHHIRLAIV